MQFLSFFTVRNLITAVLCGSLSSLSIYLSKPLAPYFLITTELSFFYFPAGVKLLLVLIGGFPAVLGIFIFSVLSGVIAWPEKGFLQILEISFFASACYPGATAICKKLFNTRPDLSNLLYWHIAVLSVIATVMDITVHNLIYFSQAWTDFAEYCTKTLYVTSGDPLGCFVVIGLFTWVAGIVRRRI